MAALPGDTIGDISSRAAPLPAAAATASDPLLQQWLAKPPAMPPAPNIVPFQRAKQDIAARQNALTPPPAPELAPTPTNAPHAQFTDTMKAMGSPMMLMALLGGALTRTPITSALTSATGLLTGLHQGDMEKAKNAHEEFNQHLDAAIAANRSSLEKYQAAREAYGDKSDQLANEWRGVADQQNNELIKDQIAIGRLDEAWKFISASQKNQEALLHQRGVYDQHIAAGWGAPMQVKLKSGKEVQGEQNKITGEWRSLDGTVIPASDVESAQKLAGGGIGGSFKAIYTSRILLSGNEAAKDLANVVQLPTTASTGIFGGRTQGPSLTDATKEVLANTVTSQEMQLYNVMATGFQRSLATIEASGLRGTQGLSDQMNSVMLKEGDTNLTKLSKLAQIRQIVDAGLEITAADPTVPPELKDKLKDITDKIRQSVPFTQTDVIALTRAQQMNPDATLSSIMPRQYRPGDIIHRGDKDYRVTGGDPTNPDLEPVEK